MKSSDVALRFIGEINSHSVEGLVSLMTSDHSFIDSLGSKSSRPSIEEGWRQYFELVPDYWVKVDQAFSEGGTAVLVGRAGGTLASKGGALKPEKRWEAPAVWTARVVEEKIAEWRVYCDNEPLREKMRK